MPVHLRPALILAAAASILPLGPARAATPSAELPSPLMLAMAGLATPAPPEFAGVFYRPRSSGSRSRNSEPQGFSQIHAGAFDPDGTQSPRFNLGIRGGAQVDRQLQLGLALDWMYKSEVVSTVTSTSTGPGGVPLETRQEISSANVHMFPIMAFAQISGPDGMGLIPYIGGGGGYEVMLLTGENYLTGEWFEATYGGWGWQGWVGLGLPLGNHARLTGEVFLNGAVLGRDVTDPVTGAKYRETVDADGKGFRAGIAWGY